MKYILILLIAAFIGGCAANPESIHLGKDTCDFCHMIIANKQFGGEILTKNDQTLKFDDPFCLASYRALRMDSADIRDIYLVNYARPHNFINSKQAILIEGSELHSPMGGNTAAFDNQDSASATLTKINGKMIGIEELFLNKAGGDE